MHPIVQCARRWLEFNGNGRIQARTVNLIGPNTNQTPTNRNVRLVGMTVDELPGSTTTARPSTRQRPAERQHAAGRHHPEHAPGVQRQLDLRDRLLGSLGVRKDATSRRPTARTASSSRRAIARRARCCSGRRFHALRLGVSKQFPIDGTEQLRAPARRPQRASTTSTSIRRAPTSNPATNAGTGTGIFQTTTAYTDLNNTYDPAAASGCWCFGFIGNSCQVPASGFQRSPLGPELVRLALSRPLHARKPRYWSTWHTPTRELDRMEADTNVVIGPNGTKNVSSCSPMVTTFRVTSRVTLDPTLLPS